MVTRAIKNDDDLALLKVFLGERKKPFTVDISEGRNRSDEQNNLSHIWYGEIADQTGEDREDVRARCKLEHGVPILRRDKEKFREVYNQTLLHLTYEQKIAFVRYTDMQVTRMMNVGQMTEYLDVVFRVHAEHGIELTIPPDRYAFDPDRRKAA